MSSRQPDLHLISPQRLWPQRAGAYTSNALGKPAKMPSEEATKATARGLDYYECLGLTRNADVLEIRRTYRRLALKYHPDCNKDVDSKEEFARICEAYDVLSDRECASTRQLGTWLGKNMGAASNA
eukprot:1149490-Pelagomonas_calceolata.AAC.5